MANGYEPHVAGRNVFCRSSYSHQIPTNPEVSMPLSDLTPEQQSAFHRRLKELQMNPEQVIKRIDSETHKGPMILSADPKVSTFKGHTLTITSLDEAKRLGGNADSLFEQGLMKERDFEIPNWPASLN